MTIGLKTGGNILPQFPIQFGEFFSLLHLCERSHKQNSPSKKIIPDLEPSVLEEVGEAPACRVDVPLRLLYCSIDVLLICGLPFSTESVPLEFAEVPL